MSLFKGVALQGLTQKEKEYEFSTKVFSIPIFLVGIVFWEVFYYPIQHRGFFL